MNVQITKGFDHGQLAAWLPCASFTRIELNAMPEHRHYRVYFERDTEEPVNFRAVSDTAALAFVDALYLGKPEVREIITTSRAVRA